VVQAHKLASKAIELNPNFDRAYRHKATALTRLQRYQEALETLRAYMEKFTHPQYENARKEVLQRIRTLFLLQSQPNTG
jgi:regulator of sirC expression with transglutaminase-like and TPR domain